MGTRFNASHDQSTGMGLRKTLFKYRDDGTLKLGPHYAAFPGCMSRNSYRWNVEAVRKQLRKQGLMSVAA
jgi:hypothetical protein